MFNWINSYIKKLKVYKIRKISDKKFQLAFLQYKKHNFETAEKLYNEILKKDPFHIDANYYLGILFNKLGEFNKAAGCFKKTIDINYNHANAHNLLGVFFFESGDLIKAECCYKKAIKIDPNFQLAYVNLGKLLTDLEKYQAAINLLKKAAKINSKNERAQYFLGVYLYNKQKYKYAIDHFRLSNFEYSKRYLLDCIFKIEGESNFFIELDKMIKSGENNSVIGSIVTLSKIKYNVDKPNPYCNDPFKYLLKINLNELCDFKKIFINPVKALLDDKGVEKINQALLTNGFETSGNLLDIKTDDIYKIKDTIQVTIDNYRNYFKDSKEGLIKSWPNDYFIRAWIVNMKNNGKLSPHMHQFAWLSGVIYINVPPKDKKNSGNLVLSTTPLEFDAKNNKIIDVFNGTLCLFPSSLYHHTIPFKSNDDRIVLPFDVIKNFHDE
jgi:tetratricopeptide (TPR) repeat protein